MSVTVQGVFTSSKRKGGISGGIKKNAKSIWPKKTHEPSRNDHLANIVLDLEKLIVCTFVHLVVIFKRI